MTKHPTKAQWTEGELKRLRKQLIAWYGSGPRAQQQIRDRMAQITSAGPKERQEIRRGMRR